MAFESMLRENKIIYSNASKEGVPAIMQKVSGNTYYNLSKIYDNYHKYETNIDNYNFYINPIAEFLKDYVCINYDMGYDEC